MAYLDGASFSGNRADPLVVEGTKLWMRGHRNLVAVIADLHAFGGLGAATEVIVTGGSAGGLATILHADYIATLLPAAGVKAVSDCGFFLDSFDVLGHRFYASEIAWVSETQNVTTAPQVNAACLAAQPPGQAWRCMMAPYTYPHVGTPLFMANSMLDAWQLENELAPVADGVTGYAPCLLNRSECDPAQWSALQNYVRARGPERGRWAPRAVRLRVEHTRPPLVLPPSLPPRAAQSHQFLDALATARASSPTVGANGGWIASCVQHPQLQAPYSTTVRVGGVASMQAVGDWYFGRTPPGTWHLDVPYPGNPTCPNDSHP